MASFLYNLPDIFINAENNPRSTVMNNGFLTQTVRGSTKIIDSNDNWNLSLYEEGEEARHLHWKCRYGPVTTSSSVWSVCKMYVCGSGKFSEGNLQKI